MGLAGGLATNGTSGSGGGGSGTVTTVTSSDNTLSVATGTTTPDLTIGSALTADLAAKAPLASPTFTGTVTLPTPVNATDAAQFGNTHGLQATFAVPGVLAVSTGQGRYYMPHAQTILGAIASVGTAPTGASIIVDVLKNGTTVYTGGTNRPTIAASGFVSATTIVAPAVTALAIGDYLTVNISQIGSSVAGSDLVVTVVMS